ncbi:MAGE-like protein 2 [Salvia hispanica]|uniref:MAGE-like protein 2 n=1 Tax=Salvia hispanica TaxID=49212 RepID=UPI002009116B|nr:MAGE-like protein 2 [Salvia hispanica]
MHMPCCIPPCHIIPIICCYIWSIPPRPRRWLLAAPLAPPSPARHPPRYMPPGSPLASSPALPPSSPSAAPKGPLNHRPICSPWPVGSEMPDGRMKASLPGPVLVVVVHAR